MDRGEADQATPPVAMESQDSEDAPHLEGPTPMAMESQDDEAFLPRLVITPPPPHWVIFNPQTLASLLDNAVDDPDDLFTHWNTKEEAAPSNPPMTAAELAERLAPLKRILQARHETTDFSPEDVLALVNHAVQKGPFSCGKDDAVVRKAALDIALGNPFALFPRDHWNADHQLSVSEDVVWWAACQEALSHRWAVWWSTETRDELEEIQQDEQD